MRNIEVTRATFDKVFNMKDNCKYSETEHLEHCNKYHYRTGEQSGSTIHNFIGGAIQYYLTDINA